MESFDVIAPDAERPGSHPRMRLKPKPPTDRHLWEITAIKDILWMAAVAGVLWALYSLSSVFVPIFIAIILAYLTNPLLRLAQRKWSMPRPLTMSLLLLVFSLVTVGLILGIGPLVTNQVQTFVKKAPAYVASLNQRLDASIGFSFDVETTLSTFREDPMSFLRPFFAGTGQAFGWLGAMIGTTINFALALFLVPLYYFFFGWHFDRMLSAVARFIPMSRRARLYIVLNRMDAAVSGFFHERLLIAVITGAMYAIGWAATDVPYWFLLGVGTGILSLIPYISAIGWPLAVLFKYLEAVTSGSDPGWLAIAVWPSVAYLVVQFIESWVLTPWIQRRSSDMSAVTLVIVMFIGGAVGGLFGLIFAIPVAACIKILFEEFIVPKWSRWAALQ